MGTTSSKIISTRRASQSVVPKGVIRDDSSFVGPSATIETDLRGGLPSFSRKSEPHYADNSRDPDPSHSRDEPGRGRSQSSPGGTTENSAVPESLRTKHNRKVGDGPDKGSKDADDPSGPSWAMPGTRRHAEDHNFSATVGPRMPEKWQRGDTIGTGSFGNVFLGLNNMTGELLAIKEVAVNVEAHKMKDAVEQLESEVSLLSTLNHPNILKYVGTFREAKRLFIFLEYVPGGSIASLLQRFGPLSESVIRVYTRQILKGLAYLHSMRTVHRDIKGANLLVEKNGRIKLADFGMAKQMVEHMSFTRSFKGSAFWMAPEVIRQRGHGVAADIWSVGCTMLEMATGIPPWSQCSTQVQAIFKIASSQELPTIPETLSPEAAEFILLCLQRDPAARPTAAELLNHPFVKLKEGEEEHPSYVASDEYSNPSAARPTAVQHTTAASSSAAPSTTGPAALPHGRLPGVAEVDEESASYASTARSRVSTAAGESEVTAGGRGGGTGGAGVDDAASGSDGSDVEGRERPLGRPHHSGRALLAGGEGGRDHGGSNLGTPKKKSKSKARKSRRHGSGTGEADENAVPPRHVSKRTLDGTAAGLTSGEATPKTPIIGGNDQDFASQPQQFRVKGLLGLPQLKMHANTGSAHLALPPLDHSRPPSSSVGTPHS